MEDQCDTEYAAIQPVNKANRQGNYHAEINIAVQTGCTTFDKD
jgi:hypothetical protein